MIAIRMAISAIWLVGATRNPERSGDPLPDAQRTPATSERLPAADGLLGEIAPRP